jgi:hypothetical protein
VLGVLWGHLEFNIPMSSSNSQRESEFCMSSSSKQVNKLLGVITQARAEAFLLRLANRDLEADPMAERLRFTYPEMGAPFGTHLQLWSEALRWVQVYLRLAWRAPDDRYREWCLYEMRRYWRDSTVVVAFHTEEPRITHDIFSAVPAPGIDPSLVDKRMIEPPNITAFEAAAFYFQSRIGDLAKYCGNPHCREPYFIADKRSQKFCSEKCAGSGNRESKRKWWRNNKAKKGSL